MKTFAFVVVATALTLAPCASPVRAAPVSAEAQNIANANIQLLGYVFGDKLSGSERQAVLAMTAKDFAANPAEARQSRRDIQSVMSRVRKQSGAESVASRKRVLEALYFALKNPKPEDANDAAQLLGFIENRHLIVAVDSAKKRLVTRRDLQSMLDANNFVAKLIGAKPMGGTISDDNAATVGKGYTALSADAKANLLGGEERYAYLRQTWNTLTPSRKRKIITELTKAGKKGASLSLLTRTAESGLIKRVQMIADARRARQVAQARRRRARGSGGSMASLGEKMGTLAGMRYAMYNFN